MSLRDELDRELAESAAVISAEQAPSPRVEWDGNQGTIQTGPKTQDFNPRNYAEICDEFGLSHLTHKVELAGGTKWLQSRRVESRQLPDGTWVRKFEDKWLYAFRYRFFQSEFLPDLPALYAEVGRTKPAPLKPKTGESTVIVAWADIQVGKVDHLGGLAELLERLDEKRDILHAYLKRANFDHIVVADAGDIIEGFSNFPAQHRTNALSLMDQVDVASTEFWKTLRLCERHAPVDVLSVPSNHCAWRRAGKNLAGKVTDDWGLHISKRLERLNAEAGLRLTFHRAEEWQETLDFDIRGNKLGLAHGHQASNPDQLKTWFTKMTHAGVLDSHVLLTGHFHFASLRPSGKHPDGKARWHIQAPTLDNGSSWVRNKYGEDGDPALCVFQMNAEGFDVQSFALL